MYRLNKMSRIYHNDHTDLFHLMYIFWHPSTVFTNECIQSATMEIQFNQSQTNNILSIFTKEKITTITHIDFATVHNIYRNDLCNTCNDNYGFPRTVNNSYINGISFVKQLAWLLRRRDGTRFYHSLKVQSHGFNYLNM